MKKTILTGGRRAGKTLSVRQQLKQAEQDSVNTEFTRYTWTFYSLLQSADFCLLQLLDSPLSVGNVKHAIKKDRTIIQNIFNRLGRKQGEGEELSTEQVAHLAECCLYIMSIEEEKLEWLKEQIYKLCLASKNIKIDPQEQED